jgi:hypothetical protein
MLILIRGRLNLLVLSPRHVTWLKLLYVGHDSVDVGALLWYAVPLLMVQVLGVQVEAELVRRACEHGDATSAAGVESGRESKTEKRHTFVCTKKSKNHTHNKFQQKFCMLNMDTVRGSFTIHIYQAILHATPALGTWHREARQYLPVLRICSDQHK